MWNGDFTGMTKKTAKVVCDAGPIIHLDELNCLDLLCDFQEILLADTVREEINQHRPLALERSGLSLKCYPEEYPANEPLFTMCRIFSLDAGEIEALAIMEKNPTAVFLTDDASARLVAQQMGFKVHGTIGILIRSIREGKRRPEQVLSILEDIPLKSTLYIKSSLLEEVIIRIKNEFQL
jgi:predicted nucleic acid-binding protein